MRVFKREILVLLKMQRELCRKSIAAAYEDVLQSVGRYQPGDPTLWEEVHYLRADLRDIKLKIAEVQAA